MVKKVIIFVIVVIGIIGLFFLFATGSDGGTTGVATSSYPVQYGGGCVR